MKKILLLPTLFYLNSAIAQDGPGATMTDRQSAGTVTSTGIGSLFNPDLYGGTASVNVPIYDYSINGLNLGVSIGYDTHGLRVDQSPSSVGLGWELALGSSITRQVRGVEDEVTINSEHDPVYTYIPPSVYRGSWFGENGRAGNNSNLGDFFENQHDLFTLSIGGRVFKFEAYFNSAYALHIKTSPVSNIGIRPFVDNISVTSSVGQRSYVNSNFLDILDKSENQNKLGFEVTDERGNKYIFIRGNYETKVVNAECTYYAPSTWDLSEIITTDNQRIKYTYGYRSVNYLTGKDEQVQEIETTINFQTPVGPGMTILKNEELSFKGKVSYIQKIEYPNGVNINFIYKQDQCPDLNIWPLDKIIISHEYGPHVGNSKTFLFNYSFLLAKWGALFPAKEVAYMNCSSLKNEYPNNADADILKQIDLGVRLKLNNIEIMGNDGNTKESYYSFNYNSIALPRRLSPSKDYYGYYNGKQPLSAGGLSELCIIQHTPANQIGPTYGIDKTPDFQFMKAGILEKITGGAGSSIEIKYKEHVLVNPPSGYAGCKSVPVAWNRTTEQENANDGLCIDEVTIKDGFSHNNTTKQKYEFSGGQRFFKGGQSWTMLGQAPNYTEAKIYYNNVITPIEYINGSNHGYTYAEIKTFNSSGLLMQSAKYHFTNLILENDPTKSNLQMDANPTAIANPIARFYSYRMGKPIDITNYDENGNPVNKVEYTYRDDFNPNTYPYNNPPGFYSNYNTFKGHPLDQEDNVFYYNFIATPFLVNNKTTTSYTNNGPFVKSIGYTYTSRFDLKKVSWTDDFGNLNAKEYSYTYETGPLTGFNLPTITQLFRTISGNTYLVDRIEGKWTSLQTAPYYNQYKYDGAVRLYNDGLFSGSNVGSLVSQNEEYTNRDSKGNVVETKYDEKEIYKSCIWDTRVGQKVATVTNARFNEMAYTSFEGLFEPSDENAGNWEFDPDFVNVSFAGSSVTPMTGHYYYSFQPGSSIRSRVNLANNKKYVLTVWATSQPEIVLVNPTVSYVFTQQQQVGNWKFYTAEINGNGDGLMINNSTGTTFNVDELRLYPADASMSTMTYEPLFGPNSFCNDRGNITYFEYDAMGRQTVTRDINHNVLSVTREVVGGPDNY